MPSSASHSRSALLLSPLLFAIGCGTSPPPDQPDAAALDAAVEPDAVSTVTIGTGTPACQGTSPTGQPADIGPILPDEIGDPAVARITPPSYPFRVTSVSYKLTGMESLCGTNIAQAVSVYAAPSADTPPATPTDVQRIEVAAPATDERSMVMTEVLPTPIVLTQGQDLFVAVEMTANAAQTISICLDGCPLAADDNRQFWSEQTTAPFTWATLYSFGIAEDYAIWANGEPQ